MKTQRIIDAHVHIGRSLNFDMKETDVLEAMKKYNIEKVLVSNSESAEADHEQKLLPQELQISHFSPGTATAPQSGQPQQKSTADARTRHQQEGAELGGAGGIA